MAACVYDNPVTMRRECWQNGVLVYWVTLELLLSVGSQGHPDLFFGANVGPWTGGRVIGDKSAMEGKADG